MPCSPSHRSRLCPGFEERLHPNMPDDLMQDTTDKEEREKYERHQKASARKEHVSGGAGDEAQRVLSRPSPNGKTGFHLVKDTTSKPTLTFAQPIQPEGWITRKGGMRPVEG